MTKPEPDPAETIYSPWFPYAEPLPKRILGSRPGPLPSGSELPELIPDADLVRFKVGIAADGVGREATTPGTRGHEEGADQP